MQNTVLSAVRHTDQHIGRRQKDDRRNDQEDRFPALQDPESRPSVFQISQLQDAGDQNKRLLSLQIQDGKGLRPLVQKHARKDKKEIQPPFSIIHVHPLP